MSVCITDQETPEPAGYPQGRVEARTNASLCPDSSHYRHREASVHRKAAGPHLKDGGIYRMRWWALLDG